MQTQHRIAIAAQSKAEALDLSKLGLTHLPEELHALERLTSLDLSYYHFGPDGARALSSLTGLTSLYLAGNQIREEGARALSSLSGLTRLGLMGNDIGDEGVRALSSLPSLSSLDLSNNGISSEGVRALLSLTSLTSLKLSNNDIGPEGVRALSSLTSLTSLSLSGNNILDDGARALSGMRQLIRRGRNRRHNPRFGLLARSRDHHRRKGRRLNGRAVALKTGQRRRSTPMIISMRCSRAGFVSTLRSNRSMLIAAHHAHARSN